MSRPANRVRLERNRRHRHLFFGCEQLEDRRVMAMVTVEAPPGVLTITGDGANDVAIIESNVPGSVDVDDGTGLSATTYLGINQIIFNGNGGDDELRIIQNNVTGPTTNNIFIPSGGIQFNGGANSVLGGDLLTMAGGTLATFGVGTYTPGVTGAGEVRYDILTSATDVDVDFTGVELVNDTTTAGAFTALQGGGNDTMVIEPGPTLPPVGGITQGPVFIDGGDRDNHGTHTTGNVATGSNTAGWLFIQQGLNFVYNATFNGAPNDILAIGVTGPTSNNTANGNLFFAAGELGLNVTYANTPAAIAAVNFNLYKVIYVPSNLANTPGGIDGPNLDALAARKTAIQTFVRNGGGIVAQTDAAANTLAPLAPPRPAYNWLEIPAPFTIQDFAASGISDQLRKTTQAIAAGLTITDADLTLGIPYHNTFTGPAGFNGLDVFVLDRGPNGVANGPAFPAGDDRAVTLGQGAVNTTIGGGATLRISGTLTTMQVGQKTSLTGNTGLGNDSLTLNGATVSLDVILIPITLTAGGGTDTVTITDAADLTGDTVAISITQVTGLRALPILFSGAETLIVGTTQGNDLINVDFTPANLTTSVTVNGFAGDDTFGTLPANRIRPSTFTTLTLNGGNPVGPPFGTPAAPVGDRLNLDMAATTAPIFVDTVGGQALSQSHLPVLWTSIETYDVIDASGPIPEVDQGDLFVRTTPANDYVVFSRGNGVSTRVRVNNAMFTFFPNNQIIAYGQGGDDYITASNILLPVDFRGEDGNDYLTGGTANDWLAGGLGNDRINGSSGDNVIWGDDSPVPSTANPQDLAVGGDDTLSALGGTDVFYGGGGNDSVSAGAGNDYASGGFGNDVLDGNDGDDRVYGGAGNDSLSGFNGNDLLSGGAGDDKLNGQSGNDVLFGGVGSDLLDGGDGNDLLITGSVANENTSRTSSISTSTFPAANYTNGADNDASLLILLAQWGSSGNTAALGAVTHDGVNDDMFGGLGDDTFCWEAIDVADNPPGIAPPDFNAPGMGTDVRIAPFA